MLVIALLIFLLTLTFVIWQPRGLNIGWSAAAGAVLSLCAGVVSFSDAAAVTALVWNATLTFIAIILISLVLDGIGFFEWAALHMARYARGSGRLMFVCIILLGAAVSGLFANDGAALIMTPIVLAMVRVLRFDDRMALPFVIASGFIADTASSPFLISNLTNIVSADYFHIGFGEYAARMLVPNLISILASLGVLYLFYRKNIPSAYDPAVLKEPKEAIKDVRLFRMSWIILGALLIAYFISERVYVPISAIAGCAAVLFLLAARTSPAIHTAKLLKDAPWHIVIFSVGMYMVVYGVRNAGLTDPLVTLLQRLADHGLYAAALGTGFTAAFLSSVMNNLPTVMIDALAIHGTAADGVIREAQIYANVIGTNLGPKITPIGSLATLLWLHVLSAKNLKITWGYYFKVGILLTVPTLFFTLAGLGLWLHLLDADLVNPWWGAALLTAVLAAGMAAAVRWTSVKAAGRRNVGSLQD